MTDTCFACTYFFASTHEKGVGWLRMGTFVERLTSLGGLGFILGPIGQCKHSLSHYWEGSSQRLAKKFGSVGPKLPRGSTFMQVRFHSKLKSIRTYRVEPHFTKCGASLFIPKQTISQAICFAFMVNLFAGIPQSSWIPMQSHATKHSLSQTWKWLEKAMNILLLACLLLKHSFTNKTTGKIPVSLQPETLLAKINAKPYFHVKQSIDYLWEENFHRPCLYGSGSRNWSYSHIRGSSPLAFL